MKVVVTGATGFIGQHVVPTLLERGHQVIALARNIDKAKQFEWFRDIEFIACDIHSPVQDIEERVGSSASILHLAWPGLPNYKDLFHFEENLHADYRFLKRLVVHGIEQLVVTGTCFEYGMQSGALSEELVPQPSNPYGFAKDTLRQSLHYLKQQQPFRFKWARLFYMYGQGQNTKSILAQLDQSIDRGDKVFPMSGGEQLRDYLPVEEVAVRLVHLLEHPHYEGVLNICQGKPISIRRLVEEHLDKRGVTMKLDRGHYPYPTYEPMAFWGSADRYHQLMETNQRRRV